MVSPAIADNSALRAHVDQYRRTSLSYRNEVENHFSHLTRATQQVLILNGPKEDYTLKVDHDIPTLGRPDEILVKVLAIGLNPIDWKAPAFNFGIPKLPWINGRDLAGIVIKTATPSAAASHLQVGDVVLVPSTDYRDIRKAAFQEYAIATHFNAARVPPNVSIVGAASVGVAFVAAAFSLGVSLGLDFGRARNPHARGPDLLRVLRDIETDTPGDIPPDVRAECFSIDAAERARPGDWLAIWGASTTSGYITLQLAKLCGLRVIAIADIARHGARLHAAGADVLVDRLDPARAVQIVRGVTEGRLRYAVDTVGKESATLLQEALWRADGSVNGVVNPEQSNGLAKGVNEAANGTVNSDHINGTPTPNGSVKHSDSFSSSQTSHLLGLTGLPRPPLPGITPHTVPIKLFHSSSLVGAALMTWLERLLLHDYLRLPAVIEAEGGLAGVNDALRLLRDGGDQIGGKRIVVEL